MMTVMKVVVIGARGMLGRDVSEMGAEAGLDVTGLDLPEVDITVEDSVRNALSEPCDWLINCAAYTDVDGAEHNSGQAFAINGEGPRLLARWCRMHQARLLHISTDYVFSGLLGKAYRETDSPQPLNQYGASKWAGEQAIHDEGCRYVIARTQSLFGCYGKNFIRTIAERLRAGSNVPVRVVNDHFSAPTYTRHLAVGLLALLSLPHTGLVHVAATGHCSWFELAQAVAHHLGSRTPITPVPAIEYPRPATRPAFAVLDTSRYQLWTGTSLPDWRAGLDAYLREEGWTVGGPVG